jgi:hypothetical protein
MVDSLQKHLPTDRSSHGRMDAVQFRSAISRKKPCCYLIHDRDRIYLRELDSDLKAMSVRILKTPFRVPQANAYCERLVAASGANALIFMIPLNEKHRQRTLNEWVDHLHYVGCRAYYVRVVQFLPNLIRLVYPDFAAENRTYAYRSAYFFGPATGEQVRELYQRFKSGKE